MHHRISSRNKPRLFIVRFYVFNSKGEKVCVSKKTFNAKTFINECCIKHREMLCVEE